MLVKLMNIFITLDGPDGCGKSTQAARLTQRLKNFEIDTVHLRDPGSAPIAEKIRAIILDPSHTITPRAELFLYQAARAELIEKKIRPALQKKKAIVLERFTDATLAYQGYGRGLNLKQILQTSQIACAGIQPSLSIFLDLPAKQGLARAQSRTKLDRMEAEPLQFHEKVRRAYRAIAQQHPKRIVLINAGQSIEKVEQQVWQAVCKKFKLKAPI